MSANEVIHTSSTGGSKAGNLDQYDLIPPTELRIIAALYSTPYADHWQAAGGSFNELQNQLNLFWAGDDVDPETCFLRPALVALQALELLSARVNDDEKQLWPRVDSIYRFDRIPAEPLRLLAHHYGVGARKYSADNWQKGYDWRLTYAALNRHLWQHQSGQFIDEETGSPHLVAVVWHAITLLWFYENKPEFDTRTSTKNQRERDDRVREILRGAIKASTLELQDVVLAQQQFVQESRPVVYISGPMTGMPDHNFPAFHQAAQHYRDLGYTVINPAELPGEGGEHPWEWFLRRDLIAMLEGGADTIVLLPGWEQSRGAKLEYHVASALGFTVRHFVAPELDIQRDLSWTDAINNIVVDLDDAEGVA
ncbi:dATP/dGTP diphosphohydrolase domain-containing protein [Mycolicibacterium houstonense]|uniref:dATP/dGTP diphosphohydrolase domain-containing protein n=1 Tax=Mycolicibacterium houstonense TaxID=146021 RepID=UPI00093D61DC|nr:dATP/dGTP diphosphohydrolase domain-containing protein [Mycolicibacterium houstonense]